MTQPQTAVAEVTLWDCFSATELESVERALGELPGVRGVHVDRTRSVAHLRYDPIQTNSDTLRAQVAGLGYRCDCTGRPDSDCQPGHPSVGAEDVRTTENRPPHGPDMHAGHHIAEPRDDKREDPAPEHHGRQRHDVGHEGHAAPAPRGGDGDHAGHAGRREHGDHAEQGGHDEHAGHGGQMVADMLRRFIVSAVLTVPIVLFSPIGHTLGFTIEPPFGLTMSWFGLILATPVVWWGGWPFLSAAYRAAHRGEANMMTLIAVGILVSYLYSLVATLLAGEEVFFEAAAMLTTFSLAGHWMEMRSRFATGRAVQALLALAPPTARVRRDGQEIEVPLEQVAVGDEVVVRPGDKIPVDGTVHSGESYVDECVPRTLREVPV